MADQIFNVNCGFFDSVNRDRLYTADEMNRPYKRVITNGVFATPQGTPSTDLQVLSAGSGMGIIVKKGDGLFGDKWFENPADIALNVPANTNILPRRDSVIVQVDKRTAGRVGNIVYREGTPSSNPLPPSIGTITNVIEYRLANIYVEAGATYIGGDAIVDLRGSSECPWITSLIKQVDTSTLWEQYRVAFDNLYEQIKQEALSKTSLIRAYDSSYTTTLQDETEIPIQITQYNTTTDILEVRVSGLVLIKDIEYTVTDNSKIDLSLPVDAGTTVAFRVYKSIDAEGAETVVSQVTDLQNIVAKIKTTSDNGGVKLFLSSGEDLFAKFIASGIGFHTIYAPAGSTNVPIENNEFTCFGHLTGKGSTSTSTYGWLIAMKTDGSAYSNYLYSGVWCGWRVLYEANPGELWSGLNVLGAEGAVIPSKRLSQCQHGWVLEFSNGVTHVCPKQYTGTKLVHIPTQLTDTGAFYEAVKQLTVSDDRITGIAANALGNGQQVNLMRVYEY